MGITRRALLKAFAFLPAATVPEIGSPAAKSAAEVVRSTPALGADLIVETSRGDFVIGTMADMWRACESDVVFQGMVSMTAAEEIEIHGIYADLLRTGKKDVAIWKTPRGYKTIVTAGNTLTIDGRSVGGLPIA